MDRYRISVFYKQLPERATITQLLNPAILQSGDHYTRVFKGEMEFSNCSENNVLDELFATFNGHGKPLPPNTRIPRSICVGDISSSLKKKHARFSSLQMDSINYPSPPATRTSRSLKRFRANSQQQHRKPLRPLSCILNTVWGAPENSPSRPNG